jgi:hypothetical protein
MAALNTTQKLFNLQKGMELYLEGKFGWEKPIKVDTFADPMGENHGVRFWVLGVEVMLSETIPENWLYEQKTGFEYRPSEETIARLMLLVG